MTEIEEENPMFAQYVTSFRVRRNALLKPRFYALKAYEDNGGPIDHLISTKQALNLIQNIATQARQHFYACHSFINLMKLKVIDTTPLFQYPLTEDIARSLIVRPEIKSRGYRDPHRLIAAIEHYPLKSMVFAHVYQALAERFQERLIHDWQMAIESNIKKMLKRKGMGKQLDLLSQPEQIAEQLARFFNVVNQAMTCHLFEKFYDDLREFLCWLLKFANRLPEWRKTKPYELHQLGIYEVANSEKALLVIRVSVQKAKAATAAPIIVKKLDGNVTPGGTPGFIVVKKVPFKTRLRDLRPAKDRHAVDTHPLLEEVYFVLYQTINSLCEKFASVKRIEPLLYKRMKFKRSQFLQISSASAEKDTQVMYEERGRLNSDDFSSQPLSNDQDSARHFQEDYQRDEIVQTRERIEFVIKDHLEAVEEQTIKLKHYVRYHGLTFDDIIFELKRVIFENNVDTEHSEVEEEDDDADADANKRGKERPSSAEARDRLRKQVADQEVTDHQYTLKYQELTEACWDAESEIEGEYDFGLVVLDCRLFKEQCVATIRKLKEDMEHYLVTQFKAILDVQVIKNEAVWKKITAEHDGVDEIIAQIDLINSLQDEEIFEDLRNAVRKIGMKKYFLDSLQMSIHTKDFDNYMALYSFPNQLKNELANKSINLKDQQARIDIKIKAEAEEIKLKVQKASLAFLQFRSVGMQSKEELKASATGEDREAIESILRAEEEDNPTETLFWDQADIQVWVEVMKKLKEGLSDAEAEIRTIVRRQAQLGFSVQDFPEMDLLKAEIKPVLHLWETIEQFDAQIENWKQQPLCMISVEDIDELTSEWSRRLLLCQKNHVLAKFKGPMQFAEYILRQIASLKKFIPLLLLLKGRGMQQTPHIGMINKEFGVDIQMKETNFRWLQTQDLQLGHKIEFIRGVADLAAKEYSIKMTLDQTEADLEGCVVKWIGYQGSFLLVEVERDLIVMKECQLKANGIVQSTYARRYREPIERLVKMVKQMVKFYNKWLGVQKLWAYMVPIFSGSDLSTQMEHQYGQFMRIDREYRGAMGKLATAKRMTYKQFWSQENLKEAVYGMVRSLDALMKSLKKYIEDKREQFPRFYFLSNEQIIEMCGIVQDIDLLERNFHKMFEGVDRLIIVYREHQMTSEQRQALLDKMEKEKLKADSTKNRKGNQERRLTVKEHMAGFIESIYEDQKKKQEMAAEARAKEARNQRSGKAPKRAMAEFVEQLKGEDKSLQVKVEEEPALELPILSKERLFSNALSDALSNRRQRKVDPDDYGQIRGVANQDGEYIEFDEPIQVTTTIEAWMVTLEFAMKHAVSKTLLKCHAAYQFEPFKEWISKWPTQFVLIVLELDFTQRLVGIFPSVDQLNRFVGSDTMKGETKTTRRKTEKQNKAAREEARAAVMSIKEQASNSLKKLLANIYQQVEELSSLILEQLTSSRRTTLNSLIIQRVHCRDVILGMLSRGVQQSGDFLFKVQVKYFLLENDHVTNQTGQSFGQSVHGYVQQLELDRQVTILKASAMPSAAKEAADIQAKANMELRRQYNLSIEDMETALFPASLKAEMLSASLPYGFEYLPNTSRLVITPLTEKVFQSLFLALHYGYGGAPVGPVGTGKTESVKELSKMIARHCFVFNCQSSIDHDSITKFFKGLAANGSWVCFDEFNRLEVNVLSLISQHIIVIQRAKAEARKFITVDGTVLKFQRFCAPFITMNPFFVGRTPLPDNLKALFRVITMVVPNTTIIAEIILYSNGFCDAQNLAYKVYRLFELLNEQLKFCAHYDFGLRTIKTILVSAGKMKLRSINVQTPDELALEKADVAITDHMMAVHRVHREKVAAGNSRGGMAFRRQNQQRVKKDRHVVKLEDEKEDEAHAFRVNYARIKGAFLDQADRTSTPGQVGPSGSTSGLDTELSGSIPQSIRKARAKRDHGSGSDTDSVRTESSSSSSEDSGADLGAAINVPFLINELGCRNPRVRRAPKLLDQFLLLKAIIDGSLPKLLFTDIKIFQHICQDIFPEIEAPELTTKFRLKEVIETQIEASLLCLSEDIVNSVLNLYSAMQARHGIMCIGAPMAGKTTAIKLLVQALQALHAEELQTKSNLFMQKKAQMLGMATEVEDGQVFPASRDPVDEARLKPKPEETQLIQDVLHFKGCQNLVICPKAVTLHQLMGRFDETSREWADGLLSSAIRNCVSDATGKDLLVTFDGPVEPDWVENINSVLDDNKRLNLVTGEVIYLTAAMRVLLETADLTNCSPATVSRVAIVYFPREQLPLKAHFNGWLMKLPKILQDQRRRLDAYFNYFMPNIIANFIVPSKLTYPININWAVKTFCLLFDGMIAEYRNSKYRDERFMKKILLKLKRSSMQETSKETKGNDGLANTVQLELKQQQSVQVKPTGPGAPEVAGQFKRQSTIAPSQLPSATGGPTSQLGKKGVRTINALITTTKIRPPEYRWCDEETPFENSIRFKQLMVDSFFMYSLIWAFGSFLTRDAKVEFNIWIQKCFDKKRKGKKIKPRKSTFGSEIQSPLSQQTIHEESSVDESAISGDLQSQLSPKSSEKITSNRVGLEGATPVELLSEGVLSEFVPDTSIRVGVITEMISELPKDMNVFEIFFDIPTLSWQSWKSVHFFNNSNAGKKDQSYGPLSNVVMTQDFMRMQFIMQRMQHAKKPLLFIGPTASGKSTMLRNYLKSQDNVNKMTHMELVSCSLAATANKTQVYIEQRLQVTNRYLIQPHQGKSVVFMFDDINMSHKDKWGDQSSNELMRQWLNYGGWYQTKSCAFRRVKDITMTATVSLLHEKEVICERLGWNFCTIGYFNFADSHLEHIYTRILTNYFANASDKGIQDEAPAMILKASLNLSEMIQDEIRPSPTNFLEHINQRHLLYILKGIIEAPIAQYSEWSDVATMWIHEVCRAVLDRYYDPVQQASLFTKVKEVASEAFKINVLKFRNIKADSPMFCYGCPEGKNQYRKKPEDEKIMLQVMTDALIDFNSRSTGKQQIDVVLFNSVIEKVLKINRSLRTIGGNTILVANEGSGSFELVKIAIKMSDWEDLVMYEKDSELEEDWRVLIKETMSKVIQNRNNRHVLHVEERDVSSTEILLALDAIAAHGEIFQYFTKEELDSMVSTLRQRQGPLLVNDQTNAQMLEELRTYLMNDLTIIIQLSPRSKVLLSFMRETLHLVNTSQIIQFGDWNRAGFEYMATKYFTKDNTAVQLKQDEQTEEEDFDIEHIGEVILYSVDMHNDCEIASQGYLQETGHYVYVSPQLFENFLRTYKRLLKSREEQLMLHKSRFAAGNEGIMKCLRETELTQDELQKRAPQLVKRQQQLENLIDEFKDRQDQVKDQKQLMNKKEIEVTIELDEAKKVQEICEKNFKTKVPQFIKANENLHKITKKQIEEIMTIREPSKIMLALSKAVCIILKIEPTELKKPEHNFKSTWCYWTSFVSPQLLGQFNCLHRFSQIDPSEISEEIMKKLEALFIEENLSEVTVGKASKAAKGLYQWVNAIRTYYIVYGEAAPIRNKLIMADMQLTDIQAKADAIIAAREGLTDELNSMRAEQQTREAEIFHFQQEIQVCDTTRSRAARLLTELTGEMQKWRINEQVAQENLSNLEGDCLLAAAMICYLAPFTQTIRKKLFSKWLDKLTGNVIRVTENMNFNSAFATPLLIKSWLGNGLLNDSYSIENAVILEHCAFQPILIDPQSQANYWLRKQLPDVKVLNIQTTRFMQELKIYIKFGNTVIIENVSDSIPRKLYPLFSYTKQKSLTKRVQSTIYIDRQMQPIDQNFKMYITSMIANPDFGSELSLMANFVNFNVTIEAFEAQILGMLLQEQETEQDQRQKLHRQAALQTLEQLKAVEDVIIYEVSRKDQDCEAMIEAGVLTDKLVQSRVMQKSIGKSLMEIKNAMTMLMRTSKLYKPISVRAAKFFYLIADLSKLNNMYQFTHEWFFDFFRALVRKFPWRMYASSAKNKERGVAKLRKRMTKLLFNHVAQSLFEKDVVLFAFLMAYYELDSELRADMRQVEFFIKGSLAQESDLIKKRRNTEEQERAVKAEEKLAKEIAQRRARAAVWITPSTWASIDKLSAIPPFNQPNNNNMDENLAAHIEHHQAVWYQYVNNKEFLDLAISNAAKADAEQGKDKRKARRRTTLLRQRGGSENHEIDEFSSSAPDDDDEEGKDPRGDQFTDDESGDSEKDTRDKHELRAHDAERTLNKLHRVDTKMTMNKGIPGHYEDFSYAEARKTVADIRRTETMIMQKLKMGLAKKMFAAEVSQKLEEQFEREELDKIFNLDLISDIESSRTEGASQATSKQPGEEQSNSDTDLENIEEGYESCRKNNQEEDMRIAQTIIQGVAEYTEFKVHVKKRHNYKRAEKQLILDKTLVRLCIMRCFHPDKLMQEIRSFIVHFLGKYFVEQPKFDFVNFLSSTNKKTPVLFMVGSNINCLQELYTMMKYQDSKMAEKINIDYQPLGSVEGEKIAKLIIKAACKGSWLLLDNLQLSLDIIPNLVKFLETMYLSEIDAQNIIDGEVKNKIADQKRTRKWPNIRQNPKSPKSDDLNASMDSEEEKERFYTKNLHRIQKEARRNTVLETIETNQIAAQLAEDRNEIREPTDEEQCLKDFTFPEKLAFPVSSQFRLWLSTIPVPDFPQDFARRCSKISLELPTAIRPSTQKSLTIMPQEKIEKIQSHKVSYKKLMFSITVMHAVINQRERFGSFGWTQPYLFSPNDLHISLQTLEEICQQTPLSEPLPMQLIQYLIGELNYGGKIINQEDKDILFQTVGHFINQEVIEKSGLVTGGSKARHYQNTYAKKLYNLASQHLEQQKIHDDQFCQLSSYGAPVSRNYLMPVILDTVEQMQNHVRNHFPYDDMPQIFGLHKSATQKATMDTASDIMARTYKHQFVIKKPIAKGNSKNALNKHTQMIFDYYRQKLVRIQFEIPDEIPKKEFEEALPIEREFPFNQFLVKEIQRYNLLLQVIKANLEDTKASLEGHRQHDETTEDTFESLQTEKTPKEWIKFAYPCHQDLYEFIKNLQERMAYVRTLMESFKTKTEKYLSSEIIRRFWLPGFFNQKNFLSTLMAVVARQDNISLERLHINYRIMQESENVKLSLQSKKKSRSFYINGIWLYGAKWDAARETICDLAPDDLIGHQIPYIQLDIEEFNPLGDMNLAGEEIDQHHKIRVKVGADNDDKGNTTSSLATDSDIGQVLHEHGLNVEELENTDTYEESSDQTDNTKEFIEPHLSKRSHHGAISSREHEAQQYADTHFMCPLYVNFMKNRTTNMFGNEGQLIAMVPIPSKMHPAKFWIQRGVCLLCYTETVLK